MKTLVYLSFGGGSYSDEALYAILSALHEIGPDLHKYRIVVYTDDPAPFDGLPVNVETVDQATLVDWAGPCGHIYRRKVFAIRDTLNKFGGAVTFCDTDTYFLEHPRKLFARIRPGHTVMHLFEGSPLNLRVHALAHVLRTNEFWRLGGERWAIGPDTPIINSGVIGIHEADARLLDEVIHLIDQICPLLDYFGTEQFSFSACLPQYLHAELRPRRRAPLLAAGRPRAVSPAARVDAARFLDRFLRRTIRPPLSHPGTAARSAGKRRRAPPRGCVEAPE